MDIHKAIELLVPAAQYKGACHGNTEKHYNRLIWLDARQQPTWAELEAVWASYTGPSDQDRIDRVFPGTDTAQVLVSGFHELANRVKYLEERVENLETETTTTPPAESPYTRNQIINWLKNKLP